MRDLCFQPSGHDITVRILLPEGPVPQAGWPALVALDGHAALQDLDDILAKGTQHAALVALCGAQGARFDRIARTRDYTPPDPTGRAVTDPRGRTAGGAGAFGDLLSRQILPQLHAMAPIDPARRMLWGHSYGGLFVLHHAMAHGPALFARHIAASPALWWDHGRFHRDLLHRLARGEAPRAPVTFHAGSAERERASRPATPEAQPMIAMRDALPADALPRLAQAMGSDLRLFPGLSHGESFTRSLREVWHEIAVPEQG